MRLAFVLFVLVSAAAHADPRIGDRAPALPDADVTHGVVVVDFFASWCGPCHQAMAALDTLARAHPFRLVVVDVAEPPARAHAFFAAHPLPPGARLVLDANAEIAHRWGEHRLPTTFILSAGTIRHINRGYGPGYPARLARWLEPLLRSTASPAR